MRKIEGRVWRFGDNVDTDAIIPAIYANTTDPNELAKHCMKGIYSDFPENVRKGDIIVAGKNFGCGSSREHAVLAIKYSGIGAVIAFSFARIFYRNAFNIGLPAVESAEASNAIKDKDRVMLDLQKGTIWNKSNDEIYRSTPIPDFMLSLLSAGGLLNYVKKTQ
jgi:3-isopropylmalate dehydratase small subunit